MKLYGLTGGSGVGKSTVAARFVAHGWGLVDADAVYRGLCIAGSPLLRALQDTFGDILTEDGSLNRPVLAAMVFSDPSALARLNAITRPLIWKASQAQLGALAAQGVRYALYDAPTLFQVGLETHCDAVIGVLSPRETRIRRVMARDGLDAQAAAARIDAQPDNEFYRTRCDFLLQNDGTPQQLAQRADALCEKLKSLILLNQSRSEINMDLFYEKKTGWETLDKHACTEYAEGYKAFVDEGKTERDAVKALVRQAQDHGYHEWKRGMDVRPGSKIYQVNRDKGIILAHVGTEPLSEGLRLTAAHLDAPRIDIRTVPLYEQDGMAYFKTHYYGGIKKYQWLAIPLELRGVVCVCKDGKVERVPVHVGNKPGDPKFVINDLLPHLGSEQMAKKATEIIKGENMNVLIGSMPSENAKKDDKDKIKRAILEYLHAEYGMQEVDFLSAELSCVPAFNACDIGFDRSFVGAYGHDDRVCSYSAATALLDAAQTPTHTAVCLLVDKEEIGSDGVTGMHSRHFETFIGDLCRAQNVLLEECFEHSVCLSADVCNAFDPNFPEVSEARNDARIGCGLAIIKYTGSRGKSGTSDASAELMARVRCILDGAGITWQTGQLGRVDQGGGGTVAMFLANRNIDTVDAGIPVLSMHAPFETISKHDLYMAYLGFGAFYRD